jgi:hypothetical protein
VEQDIKNSKKGIEYLKEEGYKKLSKQTFISDVILERFLNEEFKGINRTRAFGIIQILEREYDVDLSELKAAYIDSEGTQKVVKSDQLFIEKPMPKNPEWKRYIKYFLGLLILSGLAYLFVNLNRANTDETEVLIEKVEENESIVDKTQKNLKKFEQNRSIIEVQKDDNLPLPMLGDDEKEDFDLDKVVLKMIKERNITVEDQNISSDAKDTNQTVKNKLVIATTQTVSKSEDKEIRKQKVQEKKAVKGNLYIKPKKRAWVGIIYLDNHTKKDFLIHSKLPLDSSRDQLIVIGHKFFDIYNKNYSINFIGRGPVRFIYRDGELMEINKKEFKKTSAGVSW